MYALAKATWCKADSQIYAGHMLENYFIQIRRRWKNGKATRTQWPVFSYNPIKTRGKKELEKRAGVHYHV